MTEEKWREIVGKVLDNFEVIEHKNENLETGQGEVEYIIFNSPTGKIKLERAVKPLVLEKRGLGSRRIGSKTKVEYIYSETEKVDIFKVYKWKNEEWEEIELGKTFQF